MFKTIITLCLLILAILTLFSVVLGTSLIGTTEGLSIDEGIIINGTTSTLGLEGTDNVFSIDPLLGAVVILIVIIALAAVLGIQVLGSGLSPESIRIIMIAILYSALWGLLSVLASPLILEIEIFGSLIYIGLTLAYTIGVIQKIGEG